MLGVELFGVADHAEQTDALGHAIDGEVGIEDFVAAVLAVGLRKHHQLNVGRVAVELCERFDEVIDFIKGEREAKLGVGSNQGCLAPVKYVNGG